MSHGYKTQQLGLGMKKVVFCEEKSIVGCIKHVFKLLIIICSVDSKQNLLARFKNKTKAYI